jgi:hypothetical protein
MEDEPSLDDGQFRDDNQRQAVQDEHERWENARAGLSTDEVAELVQKLNASKLTWEMIDEPSVLDQQLRVAVGLPAQAVDVTQLTNAVNALLVPITGLARL